MKKIKPTANRLVFFIVAAFLFTNFSLARSDLDSSQNNYETIDSCDASQKIHYMAELKKGKAHNPKHAMKIIDFFICQPFEKIDEIYFKKIVPNKIKRIYVETGATDPQIDEIHDSSSLFAILAKGKSWNGEIRVEQDEINFSYSPNEACINSLPFKFVDKNWRMVEFSQACD